jgi:hypothetical protein
MRRAREELAASWRSFPFGRYVIFYTSLEDGIDVVRVLHSARDIDSALGVEQQAAARLGRPLGGGSRRPACRVDPRRHVQIADVDLRFSAISRSS